MCSANCQNPYTFNGPLAAFYVCTMSGTWNTIPPALHDSMWPDCTGKLISNNSDYKPKN